MNAILEFQHTSAETNFYQAMDKPKRYFYHNFYKERIPKGLPIHGTKRTLMTKKGVLISRGYEKIVIGDYGAYIQFSQNQAYLENIHIPEKECYKISSSKYRYIKHVIYHVIGEPAIDIFQQKELVDFADYIPDKYYIDVFSVKLQ